MTKRQSRAPDEERLPVGRDDPILQELWQVKARINAEVNYDVALLATRARALDVAALMRRVAKAIPVRQDLIT